MEKEIPLLVFFVGQIPRHPKRCVVLACFRGPNTEPQVVVVYLRFPRSPEINLLFLLAHDVSIGRQAGTLGRLLLGVEGKSSKGSLGRLRGSTGMKA